MIYLLAQGKSATPYVFKHTTKRFAPSVGNFGITNPETNLDEIPLHHSSVALCQVFPSTGINYPNRQSYLRINARTECITKEDGICCKGWTHEEAEYAVRVMRWFILVLFCMQIPTLLMCLGGTDACVPFFNELKTIMMMMLRGANDKEQCLYQQLVCVIEDGTHFFNWVC